MASLRDIRRQIHSVENIKKITQAMERVAAVHLKRAQKKAEQSAPYAKKLKEILDKLVAMHLNNPLFLPRTVKKTGFVIVTADKGLCGSYNSSIVLEAEKFLKNYSVEDVELITVGKKAHEHFYRTKWKTHSRLENWGGKIGLEEIKNFSQKLVNLYLDGTFDEIWLMHTHYITVMNRSIILEKFLNIEKTQEANAYKNLNFILEPCGSEILSELLPRYCQTRIQSALDESYASELAARIIAMQAASRNSEDLIESLTLTKNKLRQREITREMIEISAGAEI